jgi:predicted phosphodiesterase
MKQSLPKQNIFQKILKKKPSYKFLFIVAIILVILTASTFFVVHSQSLEFTNINSKLLNSIRQKDTDEEQEFLENSTEKEAENSNNEKSYEDFAPKENDDNTQSTETDTDNTSNEIDDDDSTDDETQTDDEDTDTQDEEEPTPEPEPEPQPESPSAVVAFYADNQSDSDAEDLNHQRVVNFILNSGANPIFHAGDVMEDGTQDSLDRFNTVTSTLRSTRTFYAALGNNDRKVGDASTPSQLFLDNFVFPNNERWYSVNYGNLHMIILDSAFAEDSTTQKDWLSTDLQSSDSQSRITGVIFHHPSFSSNISSYLVNYGADFIISGHLHSYNHYTTEGIDQFVLSGQPNIGYIIARIYSEDVKFTVYNSSNSIIDTITVAER